MSDSFNELGLSETILTAVSEMGFSVPTPVQEKSIPLALERHDVIAAAQTGTGKTAAFVLPLMDILHERKTSRKGPSSPKDANNKRKSSGPRALIVTPTRELAQQIDSVATTVGKHAHLTVLTVVGGTKYGPQLNKLRRGVDVLVATPGRLIDLMERGAVQLGDVEFLVLDEADRMLDMGFWPSVKRIATATRESRQTMLFSATLSKGVMHNASTLLRDPQFVEISHTGETADTVTQYVMPVARPQKAALLQSLLEQKGGTRILVFSRTKHGADACAQRLSKAGMRADSIHSNKSQSQRERVLAAFKRSKIDVLVATDVLARGIDVSEVNYVVNYDIPGNPEDYIHRIGRTGRAGSEGFAYTFVCPDEKSALRDVERFMKSRIEPYALENFAYVAEKSAPAAAKAKPARPHRKPSSKPGSSQPRKQQPQAARADGEQRKHAPNSKKNRQHKQNRNKRYSQEVA